MGSLSYANFLNVSTFHNTGSTFASSLSERSIGKLSRPQGQMQVLQNFYTSLKAQTLSLMTNIVIFFPWCNRFTSFNFHENICQKLRSVIVVCLSFFQVQWYFMKKVATSAHNSLCFETVIKRYAVEVHLVPSPFHHREQYALWKVES